MTNIIYLPFLYQITIVTVMPRSHKPRSQPEFQQSSATICTLSLLAKMNILNWIWILRLNLCINPSRLAFLMWDGGVTFTPPLRHYILTKLNPIPWFELFTYLWRILEVCRMGSEKAKETLQPFLNCTYECSKTHFDL